VSKAMPEIIVRVLTDGEFVECVRRRRWGLQDGRAAVLYAGRLLPIRSPGRHIEVSDDFFPLEEPAALQSGAPINHTIRLYMDCSGSTARLMVDGDVVVRDFVAATLDDAAVLAKTVNTLNTPADDGHCYDWCFEFEKDRLATELRTHFGDPYTPPIYRKSLTDETQAHGDKSVTIHLTSANVAISKDGVQQLRPSPQETAKTNQLPDAVHHPMTAWFWDLLSLNAAHRGSETDSRSAVVLARWRQKVVNGPKIAEELFDELDRATQNIQRLTHEKADVTRERDTLRIRLTKKVSFSSILAEVFPEISFVKDSTSVIDEQFSSVKALGSDLRAIVNNAPEMSRNRIRGARTDWYEVHVATGSRGDGRVYFHRTSQSKVHVLVSLKEHQKSDTEWIRGLSPQPS
jgi:hypothetical protein